MKSFLMLLILISIFSCSESNDFSITKNAGLIDFSEKVQKNWNEVCVLGPYSDNDKADSLLGFHWNLEANSPISTSDQFTLLVFISDSKVNHFLEVQRGTDFSKFDNKCFNRKSSSFMINNGNVSYVGV